MAQYHMKGDCDRKNIIMLDLNPSISIIKQNIIGQHNSIKRQKLAKLKKKKKAKTPLNAAYEKPTLNIKTQTD